MTKAGRTQVGLEPPETYPLTIRSSLPAWNMNRMAFSMRFTENREAFQKDPDAYMDEYGLTADEKRMISDHDWHACLAHGMNRNLLLKIAAALGVSIMQQAADFRGEDLEDFKAEFPRPETGVKRKEDL